MVDIWRCSKILEDQSSPLPRCCQDIISLELSHMHGMKTTLQVCLVSQCPPHVQERHCQEWIRQFLPDLNSLLLVLQVTQTGVQTWVAQVSSVHCLLKGDEYERENMAGHFSTFKVIKNSILLHQVEVVLTLPPDQLHV